jgi:tetratricopeptide (TPR) repeat protein
MRHLLRAGILSVGCVLMTSCAEGSDPLDPAVQTFSALDEDRYNGRAIPDPGPEVMTAELERVKPILESFERNADAILSRPDLAAKLGLIESAYVISGRYMDLLVIYNDHVTKAGPTSAAAPRLAWSWLRLGQEKRAGELIAALLKARSDDPMAWFLQGAYWVRYAEGSAEITRDVIMAWKKALALDPLFVGFDDIDAATLRGELERMNAKLLISDADALQLAAAHIAKLNQSAPTPPPADPAAPPTAPEAPPTAPAEPTPTPAEPSVAPTPTPVVPAPVVQTPAPMALTLARAQLAADAGQAAQAEAYVREARNRHLPGPDLVASIQAQGDVLSTADLLTYLEIAWRVELDRPAVARAAREAAKRPGMTAQQLWTLSLFALRQMEDRALTRTLLDRLDADYPDDAKRLGSPALRAQL